MNQQLSVKQDRSDQITYRIDKSDLICYINKNWIHFAEENNYQLEDHQGILGTSLWAYISNPETIQIYQTLIFKVREDRQSIKVPYRCDSPALKRYMEMQIKPAGDDTIEFKNYTIKIFRRPPVPLLDPKHPRNHSLMIMCSWCKKVNTSLGWLETEEAVQKFYLFDNPVLPKISHGICNTCKDHLLQKVLS